jgi:hypothetical protein
LTAFFDKNLLRQFDLARFLIDRMVPCDRLEKADVKGRELQINGRRVSFAVLDARRHLAESD